MIRVDHYCIVTKLVVQLGFILFIKLLREWKLLFIILEAESPTNLHPTCDWETSVEVDNQITCVYTPIPLFVTL